MTLAMVLGMSMTTFAAAEPVDPAITSTVKLTGLASNVPTNVKVYQFASLLYDEEKNEYSWDIADWATNVTLNQDKNAYVVDDYDDLKVLAEAETPYINLTGDSAVEGTSVDLTLPIGAYVIIAEDNESTYGTLIAIHMTEIRLLMVQVSRQLLKIRLLLPKLRNTKLRRKQVTVLCRLEQM